MRLGRLQHLPLLAPHNVPGGVAAVVSAGLRFPSLHPHDQCHVSDIESKLRSALRRVPGVVFWPNLVMWLMLWPKVVSWPKIVSWPKVALQLKRLLGSLSLDTLLRTTPMFYSHWKETRGAPVTRGLIGEWQMASAMIT